MRIEKNNGHIPTTLRFLKNSFLDRVELVKGKRRYRFSERTRVIVRIIRIKLGVSDKDFDIFNEALVLSVRIWVLIENEVIESHGIVSVPFRIDDKYLREKTTVTCVIRTKPSAISIILTLIILVGLTLMKKFDKEEKEDRDA